jgi:primary-amine oxidase
MTTTQTLHPLARLRPEEIERTRELLTEAGYVTDATRFGYVMLREPQKRDVLDGRDTPREVGAILLDVGTGAVIETVSDVTNGQVMLARQLGVDEGSAPLLDEEIELLDEIVKADAAWVTAIAKRGVSDLTKVRTLPLTAGVFGYEDEIGKRMFRVLALYMEDERDIPWAHPIDGVVAHVDVISKTVLRVIETAFEHVPEESGDYLDPAISGPMRNTLKPISITQPEGVSFTLEDDVLEWQNWRLRIGFNGREGLTVHRVTFRDRGNERSVLYRASISEMIVNYADPSPTHAWNNYYDAGEYQFGRLANSLELGCDCLGAITYLDAVVADDHCRPKTIKNAICIHEEDFGVLWKHTDEFTRTSATRRQRRLVVSFFTTIGNYDYGFYFYFYLDGTFEVEAKATGIVFVGGHDGSDYPYATELAPGLGAPVHQHLFCARLDVAVDGIRNSVDELDVARVEMGEDNPWGAAIGRTRTRLRTESEGARDANGSVGRVWRISSAERVNRLGRPTSYVLFPEGNAALFNHAESWSRKRAGFAAHHLWVTRYERDELWAAGYAPNLHPGGAGLPTYIADDRPIDGEDIVLWHTFGLTHFPRTEDWPIMPVDSTGFVIKPDGFFDRNPTLDVPPTPSGHACACSGGECHC